MSVETKVVAGIGFDIATSSDDYDVGGLEEKYDGLNHGYFEEYGSYWSGETYACLLAKDPLNGIEAFIEELKENGFPELKRDDLKFISEVLYY